MTKTKYAVDAATRRIRFKRKLKLNLWCWMFMSLAVGFYILFQGYIMAKNMNHEGTLTSSVVVATTFLSSITLTVFLFILRSLQLI